MTAAFVTSVCVNAILGIALCISLWRQRQFQKPFDPKVSVYAQRGVKHGWVSAFRFNDRGEVPLSDRPVDAALAPISEIRDIVNQLVRRRFYVKVVRVVHRKHWWDTRRQYKEAEENGRA